MSISIQNVSRRFGNFQALSDVSLNVPSGSLTALLGPSGSGKTTLLRIIAGLETPDTGTVLFQEEDVTEKAARDREVGFVFQHYALFRHMSVFENVAFPLREHTDLPERLIRHVVLTKLHAVGLRGAASLMPGELSQGESDAAMTETTAARATLRDPEKPPEALPLEPVIDLVQWLWTWGTSCPSR